MAKRFSEADCVDIDCPKCGGKMFFEMSFTDCWRYGKNEGHYTINRPIVVCQNPKCGYNDDYDDDPYDFDKLFTLKNKEEVRPNDQEVQK